MLEVYEIYTAHLRRLAATMTRQQLREVIDFHRLALHVLTGELNRR